MSPVRLALPLPGPFVWIGKDRGGGSPGCLTVLGVALLLPLIGAAVLLFAATALLYVLAQMALIAFDYIVIEIDDWTARRRNSAAARKKVP
jgi:hypothetical protein